MIPNWAKGLPWNIISKEANFHGIDDDLVAALIMVESSGKPWKTRYEPNFKYIFKPKEFAEKLVISIETEIVHQKTSWGSLQVMGAVARELNFKHDLPSLCKTGTGIRYGCKKIAELQKKYQDTEKIIAAYNRGSIKLKDDGTFFNQGYVDKVMEYLKDLK